MIDKIAFYFRLDMTIDDAIKNQLKNCLISDESSRN